MTCNIIKCQMIEHEKHNKMAKAEEMELASCGGHKSIINSQAYILNLILTCGNCDRNVWVEVCLSASTFRFVALCLILSISYPHLPKPWRLYGQTAVSCQSSLLSSLSGVAQSCGSHKPAKEATV